MVNTLDACWQSVVGNRLTGTRVKWRLHRKPGIGTVLTAFNQFFFLLGKVKGQKNTAARMKT